MNSESSYIYSDSHQDQGLGRISPLTINRNVPTINKPTVRNRKIIQPKQMTLPKPTGKPRSVIDKNPVSTPARVKLIPQKTKPKNRSKSDKKTISRASIQSSAKPTATKTASGSGGMLDGTFNVGGMQIKKKHAAVAGSTTAGGLLLWKLLL